MSELTSIGHNYKELDYVYDLLSGNVKEVFYQKGYQDQFIHKYEYDADNRITHIYTSPDNVIWDEDASYFYYKHGPLGRMEIGQDKVQGLDYAYTIMGWIEGYWSNLQEWIFGMYTFVSRKHMQKYLAEFDFRHNHRKSEDVFERILRNIAEKSQYVMESIIHPHLRLALYNPKCNHSPGKSSIFRQNRLGRTRIQDNQRCRIPCSQVKEFLGNLGRNPYFCNRRADNL